MEGSPGGKRGKTCVIPYPYNPERIRRKGMGETLGWNNMKQGGHQKSKKTKHVEEQKRRGPKESLPKSESAGEKKRS